MGGKMQGKTSRNRKQLRVLTTWTSALFFFFFIALRCSQYFFGNINLEKFVMIITQNGVFPVLSQSPRNFIILCQIFGSLTSLDWRPRMDYKMQVRQGI